VRFPAAIAVALASVALGLGCGGNSTAAHPPPSQQAATVDKGRFDGAAALSWVKRQVDLGPRPAGSAQSRKLAKQLRKALPHGHYQAVPGGLRNVLGSVPGRDPKRVVVVGAHYDTKDIPGFVGAVDAGSGTAAVVQLARTIKPRSARPTIVFALFDGEESPAGRPESEFEKYGIRGSRVAAASLTHAESMILLDFVGNNDLKLPREQNSDRALWAKLRAAAATAGVVDRFPASTYPPVSDDHIPFIQRGIPSIDLIDFNFPCWHKTCDDMSQISESSLDATGEAMVRLLATL
jgi:hypothetical protein